MKLAGRNHVVTDRSLLCTMDAFQKNGFDGIELSVVHGMTNLIHWDYLDDYVIDRVRAFSEEKQFPVSALSCHLNYVLDDAVFEAQKKVMEAAPKYGTDIVIMSTYIDYPRREGHETELRGLMVKRTRALCDTAEKLGVRIAIEVEPNQLFHNMQIFYDVADKVKSPALKLNLDVGHLFLSEPDLLQAIRDAKEFTVHSHIDNMGRGEHCHKLPWEGDIDLREAFREMRRCGFDGFAALDVYIQDYMEVCGECASWIKQHVF